MEAFRGGKSVILAAARAASTIAFSTRTLYKTLVLIARGNILLSFRTSAFLTRNSPPQQGDEQKTHEKVEGEHPAVEQWEGARVK
jgi:hypothetical protein